MLRFSVRQSPLPGRYGVWDSHATDWYADVAPEAYEHLYRSTLQHLEPALGTCDLPGSVKELTAADRESHDATEVFANNVGVGCQRERQAARESRVDLDKRD